MMRGLLSFAGGMLLLLVAAARAGDAAQIVDLGVLGGQASQATGVNKAGEVVGASTTADGEVHAVLWTAADGITDLGVLGRIDGIGLSAAAAINEPGTVVGMSTTSTSLHAFRWTVHDGLSDLGIIGEFNSPEGPIGLSAATAISNGGRVVGMSTTPDGLHAFLWTDKDGMQDLGTLGGTVSIARGVNDAGQVVGGSVTEAGEFHAFVWTSKGGMQDLGTLGGAFSLATGINPGAEVVGASLTEAGE